MALWGAGVVEKAGWGAADCRACAEEWGLNSSETVVILRLLPLLKYWCPRQDPDRTSQVQIKS
ncbi:hypothetical protein SAMN05216387_10618 [Nitrosovibrio tenuis]|uniref:Uncharacterized protein n=1 Tax=Nitrosovibrio tenuis TaxID=1233 RepID=A0A1H7N121_9PROT|nr:hypothetical protein SAMN05216387_10618 [Nitrosovibrio tenuis]